MHPLSTACISLFLLALSIWPAFAQQPAIKPAPTPAATDSTRQIRSAMDTIPATIRRNGIRVGNSTLTPDDDSTVLDKPDTARLTAKQEARIHKIVPKKATIRALIPFLGLGQAYNRQYYKMPFLYAGHAIMGYLFIRYRDLAGQAETGYRRLLYGDLTSPRMEVNLNPTLYPASITSTIVIPAQYTAPANVEIGVSPWTDRKVLITTTATAKNAYDTYRRYRDLNILLSVALYALSIVEANVAAHLKTFDLTDDISMNVEPSVLPAPAMGFVPGVRVAFTFK
ncbi:hypothetical protein GCM10028805_62010 [Spirosoma harenae]